MLKKTITYKDYTGEEQTEDFHFHLTEADVLELELSAEGNSLSAWMQKIVKSEKGAEIIATFKKIIDVSYGVKSTDGRRFIKSPEILAEFKSTNAYSKLFMELSTQAGIAAEFVNGIMPEDMQKGMANNQKTSGLTASQLARQASEDQMKGFRRPQPQQEKPAPAVRESDLPVENTGVPAVLDAPMNADQLPPVTPQVPATQQDINSMSIEDLRALAVRQQGQGVVQ